MIEGLYSALNAPPGGQNETAPGKVLRMVKNERMGGFVPRWEAPAAGENFAQNVEKTLTSALDQTTSNAPESALGYHPHNLPQPNSHTSPAQEFGFGDIIDMINPLHHLPVVGHVYRGLTGDEIRPIGQIMGGALFGGPLGAASGLVNVVIEQETGKDMAGNAFALVLDGETPTYRSQEPATGSAPETRLAAAQNNPSAPPEGDMPGNLLTFVDMKAQSQIVIERIPAADGRTAGQLSRTSYPTLDQNPHTPREPITQVRLSQNYND